MTARAAFEVWVHPDVLRLERELLARVRALRASPDRAFDAILVLAPSRRQMLRVRETLARELGAVLGVEVLTHQALAYRLVEGRPERPAPALASRALRETLVESLLEAREGSPLADYVSGHRGALGPLTGVLRELREAGITPEELARAGDSRYTAELVRLLRDYEDALERLAAVPEGWTDRAGLARLAAEAARARAASGEGAYRAVFQVGAYELIGMNLELVRALPVGEPPVFLVPGDLTSRSWRYARRFIERHLGVEPRMLAADGAERALLGLAPESAAGAPGERGAQDAQGAQGAPSITLAHAQGPEAELNFAAREALRLVRDGAPAHEIAILARTLEPYAALAETVFARHRLPVDSSATLPLSRHPKARAFVLLARALARDFERQTVVDLLRSPFLAHGLPEDARRLWRPDSWDRASRRYGLVSGAEGWIDELPSMLRAESMPAWLGDDPEERQRFEARRADDVAAAETLATIVRAWGAARSRWRRCRTGAEHAAFLRELAARWIHRWDDIDPGDPVVSRAIRAALAGVLDELESLDALDAVFADGGGDKPLGMEEALTFVEASVDAAQLPWPSADGVRFLDVMQARGLAFRHVILIGFNADLIPRRPREDLFLRDRVRAAVRERTGKPLAVRREAREEEWLLFAMTLASAMESLTVVWQRADAEGKARTVSLFLREIARFLPGPIEPLRVPTHPARAAEFLDDRARLLSREEAALLAADLAPSPDRGLGRFLVAFDPELSRALEPAIALARAVERFEGDDRDPLRGLRYDGFLPDGLGWERHFSATSLRALARCPQTFFFRNVLGARPLEEAAEEHRFDARELGSLVHEVLEGVFADLRDAKLLRGKDDAGALVTAGARALERRWKEAVAPLRRRVSKHYPVLFAYAESAWRAEIAAFLAADLTRLATEGQRLRGTEMQVEAGVHLSRGAALLRGRGIDLAGLGTGADGAPVLPVRGAFDRVTEEADGAWLVSDYKTRGNLENQVDPKRYLIGHDCQAALYVLLAEAAGASRGARAELLGLGPEFLPESGVARSGPVELDAGEFDAARAGFEETLGVLAAFARRGRFPFSEGNHCDYCEFTSACRRNHYPSGVRVKEHDEYAVYFAAQRKTKTRPTLADVYANEEEES